MLNKMMMVVILLMCTPAHAIPVFGQGTWETTLKARDIDNDGIADAYYDTDLNITWIANANLAAESAFDDDHIAGSPNSNSDGLMVLDNARAWAKQLNVKGVTGWRLSHSSFNTLAMTDPDEPLHPLIDELDHLFKITLGNNYSNQLNPGLTNTGLFTNIQTDYAYWNEALPEINYYSWTYFFKGIGAGAAFGNETYYAWAVRDGDIAVVPEPSKPEIILIGTIMTFLLTKRARRKHR